MKVLSIFVDESGDFGSYKSFSPFYIFTMVFHDQSNSIKDQKLKLEEQLRNAGMNPQHCFHAGPIIRREEDYKGMDYAERRKCLNYIALFAKKAEYKFETFIVDKTKIKDSLQLTQQLSSLLSKFILKESEFFKRFNKLIVYYDNGQVELNKILVAVLTTLLEDVEFRKVVPANYRLFQVADLICTLQLISLKNDKKTLSEHEQDFFGSARDMKKNYFKPIWKKKF